MRLLLIAALCGSLFLTSCSNKSDEEAESTTTLRLWVFSTDIEKELNPVLEEFEALHPGVDVVPEQLPWDRGFEKILLALATKRPPDVCELGMTWIAPFAEEDVLSDLTDTLGSSADDRLLIDAATYNGKLSAAPWMVGTRLLFYNREMLREAGYPDAEPPTTWAELEEMCRKIDQNLPDRHAIGLPAGDAEITWQTFSAFLATGHVRLIDRETGKALLDEPEFQETFDFYRSLKSYALIDRGQQLDRAFGTGRIAFHVSGAWNFTLFPRDYPTLDYGYTFLPSPDNEETTQPGGTLAGGQMLVVFKQSKNQELSKELLKFLASKEISTQLTLPIKSVLPAFKNVKDFPEFQNDQARQFHAQMVERTVAPEVVPYWEEMRRDLVILLDTILLTDSKVDGLLQQTTNHWNSLAEEYRE